jgi:hypothetical protein
MNKLPIVDDCRTAQDVRARAKAVMRALYEAATLGARGNGESA